MKILLQRICCRSTGYTRSVVGTDGKNRSGSILDLEKLEEECGYHLIVVEKLQLDGKDISSTRICASLEKGDMEEASFLSVFLVQENQQ